DPVIGPVVTRKGALFSSVVNDVHSLRRHYPVRFMRSAAPGLSKDTSRPLSPPWRELPRCLVVPRPCHAAPPDSTLRGESRPEWTVRAGRPFCRCQTLDTAEFG